MRAYVDASVVLRIILKEPEALPEWKTMRGQAASVLLQVECLRTIDRLHLTGELTANEATRAYAALHSSLSGIRLLNFTNDIVARAGQTFGSPLKTLDAIHLATALAWRDALGFEIPFATHDTAQAKAAFSAGFEVLGAEL